MRTIKLSNGVDVLVDDDDYHELSKRTWHYLRTTYHEYAYCWNPYPQAKLMHRMITDAPFNMVVDHINSDGLDNQKHNLRVVTSSQNNHNARKLMKASSKHKGVHWDSNRGKWKATIMIDGKSKFLGRFDDEADAALAYEKERQLIFSNE